MSPQLRIRPATVADVDTIVDLHNDSFGPGIMNRLMYPNGISAESDAKFAASLTKMLETPPTRASGDVQIWLAELADQGAEPEVIAFAMWTVFGEERPEDEWHVVSSLGSPGGDTDVAIYDEFIGGLHEMRTKWMRGEPALCEYYSAPCTGCY